MIMMKETKDMDKNLSEAEMDALKQTAGVFGLKEGTRAWTREYGSAWDHMDKLRDLGLVDTSNSWVKATDKGRAVLAAAR